MQEAILRLASETVDVMIKTHPFAEILYWGYTFATFRRKMRPRFPARLLTAGLTLTRR